MNPLRTLAAALTLFAPLAALAGPTNLIQNGSFETYTGTQLSDRSWTVVQGDNTPQSVPYLSNWQASSTHGVELRYNVAGTAQAGNTFIELDSHFGFYNGNAQTEPCCNSWISQTVATTVGQTYRLSYWYAPRVGNSATDGINVFWNGTLLTSNNTGARGTWSLFEFDVIGTGAEGILKFEATGIADTYGGSLDSVSLFAVPAPTTYGLMLAGLGTVGLVSRRRKPV